MAKIGIIGAMEEEVAILKEEMIIQKTHTIANMVYDSGILAGKEVVLVRCGIGKVNAAICTQVLIGQLGVEAVINTGVAGAIEDNLEILDVVVSTDVLQHDFDVTGFGYELGQIPRMDRSIFPGDENLLKLAVSASEGVLKNNKVVLGRIVSGDVFVSSSQLKEKIWQNFKGLCTEMEGAAIGQTCYVNQVPFVVIRAMSDKADGSAHHNFNVFVQEAAIHSKEIVLNILKQMN